MTDPLFSIRMRAAESTTHISGAERISSSRQLSAIAGDMIERALHHARGTPDSIRLAIELLPADTIKQARLPDITTVLVNDASSGRCAARAELLRAGVSALSADSAINSLVNGAAPGGTVMRGAMIVDADSGERLEADPGRGIRVSRMDISSSAREELSRALLGSGRDTTHLREALALAGKVLLSPGIMAELCWSDDPDYTAGYVASPGRGYVRFPHLKEKGCHLGGRVFFYRRTDLDLAVITDFLEKTPVLFTSIGRLHPDQEFSS